MAKGLKVFQYIDGINDIPFPNNSNDEQIELLSYKYESQRMSPTSKITATFSYPRCLDKDWENKEIYVTYNGENYFVRQIPSSSKNNTSTLYEHNVTFYSERFILENVYPISKASFIIPSKASLVETFISCIKTILVL